MEFILFGAALLVILAALASPPLFDAWRARRVRKSVVEFEIIEPNPRFDSYVMAVVDGEEIFTSIVLREEWLDYYGVPVGKREAAALTEKLKRQSFVYRSGYPNRNWFWEE